jgi:hypothetical protein
MPSLPFPCTALPLSAAGINAAMNTLGVDAATVWAILEVETQGCGCLSDRRPQILYERHIFSGLTRGAHDAAYPGISNPVSGGYGPGGAAQYTRLAEAVGCDQSAALQSASWGMGQVMGEHFAMLGYPTVEAMVTDMCASEDAQLAAAVGFIIKNNLARFLQAKDWVNYALHYNGADYTKNRYDARLAAAHTRFSDGPLPDLNVRIGQACLHFLGFDPKGVDGQVGSNTLLALHAFQAKSALPLTAGIDADVAGSLLASLPQPQNLWMP